MFRRGPIRRAARILRQRPLATLEERPRRLLREANLHMEQGEYHRAAEMFENLGRGAAARGLVQRVPYLFLQAARAYLYAGQITPSMDLLQRSLSMLVQAGRLDAAHQNATLAIQELERLGYNEQVTQVQKWLAQTLSSQPATTTSQIDSHTSQKPRLPAKCPFCGATVRPDEVEWLDESTAECPYCGSSVLDEGPAHPS